MTLIHNSTVRSNLWSPRGWWTFLRYPKPSRRYLATSKRQSAITSPPPPKSGTNPASSQTQGSSRMLKSLNWYARQQHGRPYMTELCSMALIYCVGDLSAQVLSADGYDGHQTLRSITIGLVAAIPSRKWFSFLARNFNYSSAMASTCTKVAVNQLVYTSLFNVYFFASHAILSGMAVTGVVQRIKNTVSKSLPRSFLYWPFVMAFNFTYVKPQSRSVVTAIFAVFWQAYMSWLNAQAQKHEKGLASTVDLSKR